MRSLKRLRDAAQPCPVGSLVLSPHLETVDARSWGVTAGPCATQVRLPATARFGLVGVCQNGLNVGVFALALNVVPYLAAAAVAALAALVVSFVLNRYWTFGHTRTNRLAGHAARYALVFASSIGLGIAILSALVELVGLSPLSAQVAAILIVAPLSFLTQRAWVFR
jgi:putative flippase GtrA